MVDFNRKVRELHREKLRRRTLAHINKPAVIVGGRAWCQCEWELVDDTFKRCKKCRVLMVYKAPPPQFVEYLDLLQGRTLPPTTNVYSDIAVIDKLVLLRWSQEKPFVCYLLVRFPQRWVSSGVFCALNWQDVSDAITPVLKSGNAARIFLAARTAVVGEAWALSTMKELDAYVDQEEAHG